jgi:hypothetical protein
MPALIFHAVNLVVLPLWALMIVLPRWLGTRWLLRSPMVLVPLPALYVALVVPTLPEVLPVLLRPDLATIAALLGRPEMAVVGWVHFLAFDLFVGRWIFLDGQERGLSHWLLAPILLLTLLLGPCGLLAYLAARAALPARSAEGTETAQVAK